MLTNPKTYIRYANGASRSTRNITSAAWVILSPTGKLMGSRGLFLGPAMNNATEYSEIIELLYKATILGISHLVVRLDS